MTVVGVNFYLTRKKLQSKTLKNLNANLEKVNLFWSNSSNDFSPLSANAIENDASRTLRGTLLMGLLGLISVPGFLLLIALVLSIHMLARSRKEIAIFNSPLVSDVSLPKEHIENLVKEFSGLH